MAAASKLNDCGVIFWRYENELKSKNEQGLLIADKVKDLENPGKMILEIYIKVIDLTSEALEPDGLSEERIRKILCG